jgi:hypothetical protein
MALPFVVSGYNKRATLWANGGGNYLLYNIDYNYLTHNGSNAIDPATASLPVKDTDSLIKFTQIFPAPGFRHATTGPGTITYQGIYGIFWSNTPHLPEKDGYDLRFTNSSVQPTVANTSFLQGFSIRCVRI